MAAPAVHVIDHKPRDRRHIAVPGPGGSVGVAVIAGALQYAFHLWRHKHHGLQRVRCVNGRIGVGRPNQLNANDQTAKPKQRASKKLWQLEWLRIAEIRAGFAPRYAFISLGRTASARMAPTTHKTDICTTPAKSQPPCAASARIR